MNQSWKLYKITVAMLLISGLAACGDTPTIIRNMVDSTAAPLPSSTPTATEGPYVADWILFGTPTRTQPGVVVAMVSSVEPSPTTATNTSTPTPGSTLRPTASKQPSATSQQASGQASGGSGNPDKGKVLFNGSAGCTACHDISAGITIVGPSLKGIASRAGNRVPGMSAAEYIHNHIVNPKFFTVPNFPAGVMPQNFAQMLSPAQIDDLVSFLLTLK